MIVDVLAFVALVVLFLVYDRSAAGNRPAVPERRPRAEPIDLSRRRAALRGARPARTAPRAKAL
jgi:hypothetical protein